MRSPRSALRLLPLVALALAVSLPGVGCEESEDGSSNACADPATFPADTGGNDARPLDAADASDAASTPPSLVFKLELAADPKQAPIPALTFAAADGLDESLVAIDAGAPPSLRSISKLSLWAGETAAADAMEAWVAKIAAFDPCAAGDPACDATLAWTRARADLTRSATLTVSTSDGVWLARYELVECWPTHFLAARAANASKVFPVATLGLSALPKSYALNPAHPFLAGALAEYGLVAKSLPDATVGEPGPQALSTQLLRDPFVGLEALDVGLEHLDVGRGALGRTTRTPAPTRPSGDFLPAHNFTFEIEGVTAGGFVGVDGGGVQIVDYRDGDDPVTHKRAGKAKYKNIVLRVGTTSDTRLYKWRKAVFDGKVERKSGSVVMTDREGNEILRVNLTGAYPVQLREAGSGMSTGRRKAPELDVRGDAHVVEELELVAEKIERN